MTEIRPISVPRPLKLTLDDFALLHEAGAFDAYSKVELIEGVLYAMTPQQTRHAYAKTKLAFRLYAMLESLGSEMIPLVEGTVAMPPRSAPEPDIAVGRFEPGASGYMPLSAISLVIEVSDTSLRYDLGKKRQLYARHNVAEYWVVDLRGARIHQFWSPAAGQYGESREVSLGHPVESLTIPGLAVETDNLI
ncbi:MAG: Uma2 family endonuclease [Alphaproteobacteria bacterium]|nr:MAG: Uma2 family endonuclease [Alphaproteobacteria bacterium]